MLPRSFALPKAGWSRLIGTAANGSRLKKPPHGKIKPFHGEASLSALDGDSQGLEYPHDGVVFGRGQGEALEEKPERFHLVFPPSGFEK